MLCLVLLLWTAAPALAEEGKEEKLDISHIVLEHIKDSYGCAFAPFTVSCFDEVFIVDPSYYEGNVADYIKENGYTDVLVINSVIYANTYFRVNDIMSIIK